MEKMNYLAALKNEKQNCEMIRPKVFVEKCKGGCLTMLDKPGLCTPCIKRGVAIGKCDFCKRKNKVTLLNCCKKCMEADDDSCRMCGGTDIMTGGACLDCWKEACREDKLNAWD